MKKRLKALEERVAALEARDHPAREAPADTPPAFDVVADCARSLDQLSHDLRRDINSKAPVDIEHYNRVLKIRDRLAAAKAPVLEVPDEYAVREKRSSISHFDSAYCKGVRDTLAANGQSLDDLPEDGGLV